jgi:hypothetical protein
VSTPFALVLFAVYVGAYGMAFAAWELVAAAVRIARRRGGR